MNTFTATLTGHGRSISWQMWHDPSCIADAATLHFLNNGGVEPEVAHLMMRTLKEGDQAIDVGANIGFFSLLMSRLVGETGKVIAIEPGVNNTGKFRQNVQLNKIKNIELIEAAAWDCDELVSLSMREDSGRNMCLPARGLHTVQVPGLSLDGVIKKAKLIKVDAEGAEHKILEGASELLGKVPYWVVELNHLALPNFDTNIGEVRDLMQRHHYEMYLLDPGGMFPTFVPHWVPLKCEKENLMVLFSTHEWMSEAWQECVW